MDGIASSSKATLYSYPASVWSRAARYAATDLGYIPELVDVRDVNLDTGEQYSLWYLRINPNGTVPTLVIPPRSTLNDSGEELVLRDSKDIIDHLYSHSPSLSNAPSSSSTSLSDQINALLRNPSAADPRALARTPLDESEFRKLAPELGTIHIYRQAALDRSLYHLTASPREPEEDEKERERLRVWLETKSELNKRLVDMWTEADPESVSRKELFERSKKLWHSLLPEALDALEERLALSAKSGEELGAAEYTLAAWLERCVHASGGSLSPSGLEALENRIGTSFKLGPHIRRAWERLLLKRSFAEVFGARREALSVGLDAFERELEDGVNGAAGGMYGDMEAR